MEWCFLLVMELMIDFLIAGPSGPAGLKLGIEPLAHGLDPSRRRAWQRRRTRRLEDVEGPRRRISELVEHGTLGIVRFDRLRDPLDRPVGQPSGLAGAKVGADASAAAGILRPSDRGVAGTLRPSDRSISAAVALGVGPDHALADALVWVRPDG